MAKVECTLCDKTCRSKITAIKLDWLPAFYAVNPTTGDVEDFDSCPICPACIDSKTTGDPGAGEVTLKPEFYNLVS